MTPKDTLIKALEERFGFSEYKARQIVEDQFDVLKSSGLFIGPEVATEGMQGAMVDVFGENGTAGEMWEAGVTEWQRGGGA